MNKSRNRKKKMFTLDSEIIELLNKYTEKTDIPASRFIERLIKNEFKKIKMKK